MQAKKKVKGILSFPIKAMKKSKGAIQSLKRSSSSQGAKLYDQDGVDYYVELKVGDTGKSFMVQVDTGSTDLLIQMKPLPKGIVSIAPPKPFNDTYGDGSFAKGEVVKGNVSLADFDTSLTFGWITSESEGFESSPVNGIMGLAYNNLSSFGEKCFFEQYRDNGHGDVQNIFSMVLGENGSLTLGGIDPNCDQSKLVWTDITQDEWYVVKLESITVGDMAPYPTSDQRTIVDSGTTLLCVPEDVYNQLLANIDKDKTYTDKADIQGPTLSFSLGNGNVNLTLTAQDYYINRDGVYCFGLAPGSDIILGDTFMQNYCTVFDVGNNRIGFAPIQ